MSYDLFKVVENRAAQEIFLKARFVIFRCQKYVKKGYIEMGKWIYLGPLKSVLGRSILHYWFYPCMEKLGSEKSYISVCFTQWLRGNNSFLSDRLHDFKV